MYIYIHIYMIMHTMIWCNVLLLHYSNPILTTFIRIHTYVMEYRQRCWRTSTPPRDTESWAHWVNSNHLHRLLAVQQVPMYIYVYIYIYIYIYMYMYTYIYVYTYMHTYTYIYVHIRQCIHISDSVYMSRFYCIQTNNRICMWLYVYICNRQAQGGNSCMCDRHISLDSYMCNTQICIPVCYTHMNIFVCKTV